jgi:2-phosphosulfolactate phosphatase
MNPDLIGKTVVLTTSNCTMAMLQVKHAKKALAGAFTNISALAEMLYKENEDVLLLCAGWKNKFSIEDSLFAGALTDRLVNDYDFESDDDGALASLTLYHSVKDNIPEFLKNSSHRHRLGHLNLDKDIEYCLKHDQASVVPQFDGHAIRLAKIAVLNPE